jgi:CDP-diacylglycerol--serine O-phosphatidyltransferase
MKGSFEQAAVAIFVAMVLDGLDGRVARMTRTQSAFGAEYDSLSDMVSFGVAPALVTYAWALKDMGRLGWIAAFIYCVGAALRLARFNTTLEVVDKRYFQGLPSPAAAALVTGFLWVMIDKGIAACGRSLAGLRTGDLCRHLDGVECPLLQFQGRQSAAQRSVHLRRRHRAGFCRRCPTTRRSPCSVFSSPTAFRDTSWR